MKIADLFINISIKGDGKTIKAVASVTDGLKSIVSKSLLVKASIAAVVVGLEQMMASSMRTGSGLLKFSTYTGLSAEKLQQWQFAASRMGVSGEEVKSSIMSVQSAMTKMLQLGTSAPTGMSKLAAMVGFDVDKAKDTFYVMEKLREMLGKGYSTSLENEILKSFGVSRGIITAMRRGGLSEDKLAQAPTLNKSEIKKLAKVNQLWTEIRTSSKHFMNKITAKYGVPVVEKIVELNNALSKFGEYLLELANKHKVFDKIKEWIEDIKKLYKEYKDQLGEGMVKGLIAIKDALKELINYLIEVEKEFKIFEKAGAIIKTLAESLRELFRNILKYGQDKTAYEKGERKEQPNFAKDVLNIEGVDLDRPLDSLLGLLKKSMSEGISSFFGMKPQLSSPINNNSNINVSQTFNHPGDNAVKLAESTKEGVKSAIDKDSATSAYYRRPLGQVN